MIETTTVIDGKKYSIRCFSGADPVIVEIKPLARLRILYEVLYRTAQLVNGPIESQSPSPRSIA